MGSHTAKFSDIFSISPTISPSNQLFSVPGSTPIIARNTARDLDYFSSVIRRPSNAPPASPTSSPERNTWSLSPHAAKVSSSRCRALVYLDEQLGKVRPQGCQGDLFDLGYEQATRRFSFEVGSYDDEECSWIHDSHYRYLSHDDDSRMVDPYSGVQSVCSEARTFHEDATSKDIPLAYYTTRSASLDYDDYPKLYPSDPKSLRHTMPSPPQSKDYTARPFGKPCGKAQKRYALPESPSVPARSRQISLPIMRIPSVDPMMSAQIPTSKSTRAQSWHASPLYSPSRKPPKPPIEMEKSVFEDYDEDDNVEEHNLPSRFRHLIRKLHCG